MTEFTGRQRHAPMTTLDRLQAFLYNAEHHQQTYAVGTREWHSWEDLLAPLRRHLRALGVGESGDSTLRMDADEPVC